MATTTNVSPLKINYLTQAQYDTALANNQINADELYFTPAANNITINLNGANVSSPSFYAPTSAGTSGYVLTSSGGGAPTWTQILPIANGGTGLSSSPSMLVNLASTTADTVLKASPRPGVTGTLPVGNGGTGATSFTANSVIISGSTTTAALTTRSISDSSSASAIGTSTSITTERDVYYGLPTINNSHAYTSSTTIYAPTAGGTANQILVSAGTTSAPTWKATANGAAYATSANGALTFGTLPVAQGGTGITSNPSMLVNLASTTAASVFAASPRPGVTGTLPIANGGTGKTTAEDARVNLGAGKIYVQTASPTGRATDLWIDTSQGTGYAIAKYWNTGSTAWVTVKSVWA